MSATYWIRLPDDSTMKDRNLHALIDCSRAIHIPSRPSRMFLVNK